MKRLIEAAHFAAKKHRDQRRKNRDASPYINHPLEVTHNLATIGGVDDEEILIAALLHDTIEDTETTREEIAELFGDRVATLVMECTDDKSLPKLERKRLQIVNAPKKSDGAKQIKICDKMANLTSILADPPANWTTQRKREYFEWAKQVVSGLLGVNKALDQVIQRLLAEGLESFAKA